jgi:predicted Ser/Thr protein kinase/type II secretory pathway pseudopilin PulG
MKGAFPTGTDTGGKHTSFIPPKIEELAAKFPQLEVLEFIGQGGMGAVYKVRQKQLDRIVALKILPPQAASGPGFAERFAREARALAKLNHPHIVTLYEFGQADGLFYFLMEFVDGTNLRQVLNAGRIAPKEALAIVPQICEALQFAHENGIVHRDIKPENILLSREGRVKIADFGVAKIVAEGLNEAAGTPVAPAGELTEAGSTIGTPQYMAPEQIKNSAEVDHRADIYSLGVVFYQMLTGELPSGKIEPPSKKVQVDVRLDEVVLRALEKKPELRYQDANVFKTQVETIAQTPAGAGAQNAEAFTQAALSRDYSLNIMDCLNRGWNLVISDFWPMVGVSALIWLLSRLAASSIVGIIVSAPLAGGLWLYFLNRIRGRAVTLEMAFSGFKVAFLQLLLVGVVSKVLTALGIICLILPGLYLAVVWTFAVPLVADKGLEFWPAMELSRKIIAKSFFISKHFWKFAWFLLVLVLLHVVGVACCYVGVFVAMPVCLAALAYAYEDIFGPVAGAAPAGAPMAQPGGSRTGAGVVLGVAAAVVLLAILGLLAAIAIPNFVRARHRAIEARDQAVMDMYQMRRDREQQLGRIRVKSDYIGEARFPLGDLIRITSVERYPDRMEVKGRYDLVSTNSAMLVLDIATTNGSSEQRNSQQEMEIFKGRSKSEIFRGRGKPFTLIDSHVVPGLPHLSMYPSEGGEPFAELYFGNQAEAQEESELGVGNSGTNSLIPADGVTNIESGTNGEEMEK